MRDNKGMMTTTSRGDEKIAGKLKEMPIPTKEEVK